jgi:hypothetical protein
MRIIPPLRVKPTATEFFSSERAAESGVGAAARIKPIFNASFNAHATRG